MEGPSYNGRFNRPRRQQLWQRTAAVLICCFAASGLIVEAPAALAETPPARSSRVSPPATVGIYLTAIPGVNTSEDSYIADFYLWSRSPANTPAPLAKVTIVRAKSQTILYEWSERFGDQIWFLRKYRCEFLNDWELGNFPFDKHLLAIAFVPNSDEFPSFRHQDTR